MANTDIGFTQIPYVRKDDTFKEWRERTNLMIQQQNNFVLMQEFDMLGQHQERMRTTLVSPQTFLSTL